MGSETVSGAGSGGAPPWQQDHEGDETFGSWLRKHREGVDIRLEQVAEHTRISLSILEAIEEERTEDLPASVFVRGFLRQYARFVGLDPEEVVNLYSGSHPASDTFVYTSSEARDRSGLWIWLSIAVLLLAAAAGYWFYGRSQGLRDLAEPGTAETTPRQGQDADAAGTDTALAAGEQTATPMIPAEGEAATAVDSPTLPVDISGPIVVTIDFVEDCWVESTVDGRRQISTLYAKGESLRLEATAHVRASLGNYPGAEVQINGRPYTWPAGGVDDRRAELNVDADFLAAVAGGASPAGQDPQVDAQAPVT